ncbi:FAD-binding oxidoreductase [Candidatus Saccharibacteria bacterium]|nr:FAD-binding oxidoreductase [Candidatus Saccharibacteria bacterium]
MSNISKLLNQVIVGNVFDEPRILEKYATDRSILKMPPEMVVLPENTDDVRRIVRFTEQLKKRGVKTNLTVRGSGLDKTGADLTDKILISMERMNRIQEIDSRSKLVRVQAGITLEKLNAALSLHGLVLPIDANPKETIGSLICNFAIDGFAGKYHGISHYVDCLEAVMADGNVLQTRNYNRRGLQHKIEDSDDPESGIYTRVNNLINDFEATIEMIKDKPTIDASGYQMVTQVERDDSRVFELTPLFYASQGTLGIITEVILRLETMPSVVTRFAAGFETPTAAVKYIEELAPLNPLSIELYDAHIFEQAAKNGKELGLFAKRYNKGYIAIVSFDDNRLIVRKKLKTCLDLIPDSAAAILETKENTKDFARIRTAMRSYLNDDIKGERLHLADDFFIPQNRLLDFIKALPELERETKKELPLYGDYLTSNYSLRPDLNLGSATGRGNALKFLKRFAEFLEEYDGILTGGSPEGRIKALVVNSEEDPAVREFYEKIKAAFDPDGLFSPDVKLNSDVKKFVKYLRSEVLEGITDQK